MPKLKAKTPRRITIDLMLNTRCECCGTKERTVTYDRVTRTGSIRRTTRCIDCK